MAHSAKMDVERHIEDLQPVRLAILGGGAVVQHLYLPALSLTRRVEIIGIADPNKQSLEGLQKAGFKGALIQQGFKDALASLKQSSTSPDGIVIALPNGFHEAGCLAALNAGFPVLCEKPLALTRVACARIADRSRETKCVMAVGMVRRLLPSVAAVRQALRKKLIGDLLGVEVQDGAYYPWLSDSGSYFQSSSGGILADMGVHYLDLIVDLVGELQPLSYRDDWQGGVEANVQYQLEGPCGLPVQLRLSRDRELDNRFVIQGTAGTLWIGRAEFGFARWKPAGEGDLEARLESVRPFRHSGWPKDFNSCFAQQFEEFADNIRGKTPPRCNADQAAHVIGLIEWAYDSRGQRGLQSTYFGHPQKCEAGPRLTEAKCVVTGASGFIGSRLVDRLATDVTNTIVAPVRSYRRVVELARFGVAMPRVPLLEADVVKEMVKGARYVFHLAYGRDGADAAKVTEEGTRNVVEAAIAAGCESVVVLSTMSVYGFPNVVAEVDESWPYNPALGQYGSTKMNMEKWCLQKAAQTRTTRIVVLNPTCVWGPQGKTYTRMPLELAARGAFCWVEGGRGLANLVYVENLVDALILAAKVPDAHGRRFLISDTVMPWREFIGCLLDASNSSIPDYTAKELAKLNYAPRTSIKQLYKAMVGSREVRAAVKGLPVMGALATKLWRKKESTASNYSHTQSNGHSETAIPPEWLAELFGPTQTRFSSELARKTLGWASRVPFSAALAQTLSWLEAMGLRHDRRQHLPQ